MFINNKYYMSLTIFTNIKIPRIRSDYQWDATMNSLVVMPSLYLLRQVRSKFNHLSTYTMCRSVSTIALQLELQPLTIWTLSDQESSHLFIHIPRKDWILAFQGNRNTSYQRWGKCYIRIEDITETLGREHS